MPVKGRDGHTEWIGWMCVEADQARFRIVRDVPMTRGKGTHMIETEMIDSVEVGTLQVVSALTVGGMALVQTEIRDQVVHVVTAGTPSGCRRPAVVRVVIEGVRKGHPERWPRFTAEEAQSNADFWDMAHVVEMI